VVKSFPEKPIEFLGRYIRADATKQAKKDLDQFLRRLNAT